MIYPKNKLSSAGASTLSRKNYTNEQRDEIKRQLAERLSKKYGLDLTEQINAKVQSYLNGNQTITAEGIQNLEQEISRQKAQPSLQQQQSQNQSKPNREEDDQKSVVSKMSGASNFDVVDKYTQRTEKNTEEKKSQKMTGLHTKKIENDLQFLNEENQWGAIYKYNKYLYDKETDIKRQREAERKKKIKEELDQQVVEKQSRKVISKQEDNAFFENQIYQCQLFDQKEQEKVDRAKQIKQIEKQARDQQVKEIKRNRRQDEKQEKALDSFMISKVREELEDEQKFLQFKKEHQYQVMQKLLAENEEKKKNNNKLLYIYRNSVYDLSDFAQKHPGGRGPINTYKGQDLENIFFNPAIHRHSQQSLNTLEKYKCGIIESKPSLGQSLNNTKQSSTQGSSSFSTSAVNKKTPIKTNPQTPSIKTKNKTPIKNEYKLNQSMSKLNQSVSSIRSQFLVIPTQSEIQQMQKQKQQKLIQQWKQSEIEELKRQQAEIQALKQEKSFDRTHKVKY